MTLAAPIALVDPWVYIRQAFTRLLRSNLVLEGQLPGGWSEGVAPKDTDFPRGIYQLHYSPGEYDWSGWVTVSGIDVGVFSKTQGEAASLDQLVFATLQDARLDLEGGLTSLVCRRVSTYSLVDAAPDGTDTVFQQGGIYSVQVAQSNPVNRTLAVTLTSTIG
jgi:hypothetical protein